MGKHGCLFHTKDIFMPRCLMKLNARRNGKKRQNGKRSMTSFSPPTRRWQPAGGAHFYLEVYDEKAEECH